ncbi:hypothetical protein V5T82_11085 [Magnetovibrio sp. PR-2]|uniref:hypothetical protein n=1 Tax=Magnetovibrio sp. PR-2 TaxID=3120356 RepID=UPI002FCE1EED
MAGNSAKKGLTGIVNNILKSRQKDNLLETAEEGVVKAIGKTELNGYPGIADIQQTKLNLDERNHFFALSSRFKDNRETKALMNSVIDNTPSPDRPFELASSLQQGMAATQISSGQLRSSLEFQDMAPEVVDAGLAAQNQMLSTGQPVLGVVGGVHAVNSQLPSVENYYSEFSEVDIEDLYSALEEGPSYPTSQQRKDYRHGTWRGLKSSTPLVDLLRTTEEVEKDRTWAAEFDLNAKGSQKSSGGPVPGISINPPAPTTFAPVGTPAAPPSYKTDVITREDKHLIGFAERHGMSWQEVFALNKDTVSNPNYVQAGQSLKVYDTPDKAPASSTPSSRSHGLLDKAVDAGYPSQEYTEVDNLYSQASINAYLDSFRAEVKAPQTKPAKPQKSKKSTFGPSLKMKMGEDPMQAANRYMKEVNKFSRNLGAGKPFASVKVNDNATAAKKSAPNVSNTPSKVPSPMESWAHEQKETGLSRKQDDLMKADAAARSSGGKARTGASAVGAGLPALNGVREVATLKAEPLNEIVFGRGEEQYVYGYPDTKPGKAGTVAEQQEREMIITQFSKSQQRTLDMNGYIHDEGGNVINRGGRKVSANEEKTWGNTEDHMAIDGARANARGQARAQNASTTGNGKFDGRGNLVGVGNQKANPNQTNRATNKDGTYSLDEKGNGAGDAGGTVICTELHRRGLLSDAIYNADSRFGVRLAFHDPDVIVGYHFWAKPLVKVMRRSDFLTLIIYHGFAKAWAEEMAGREGLNSIGTVRGRALMNLGVPLCRWIGQCVRWWREVGLIRAESD